MVSKHFIWHTGEVKTPVWIKAGRKRLAWSQRDLAKALGLTHGAVAQWEIGSNRPHITHLMDMARQFQTSASSLIGPGRDYPGELIESADELFIVHAWRRIPESHKPTLLGMMNGLIEPPPAPKRREDKAPGDDPG